MHYAAPKLLTVGKIDLCVVPLGGHVMDWKTGCLCHQLSSKGLDTLPLDERTSKSSRVVADRLCAEPRVFVSSNLGLPHPTSRTESP